MSQKGWEPGGRSRGNCPWMYRFPLLFLAATLAGTNRHLLSFDCRPAHQDSLCWTAIRLLVDKIRPKPRWSSLLAGCRVGQESRRLDGVERGKKRLRTQNGAWGSMGRRTGSSENGPASASGSVGSGEHEERREEIADGRQTACCRFQCPSCPRGQQAREAQHRIRLVSKRFVISIVGLWPQAGQGLPGP